MAAAGPHLIDALRFNRPLGQPCLNETAERYPDSRPPRIPRMPSPSGRLLAREPAPLGSELLSRYPPVPNKTDEIRHD